MGDFLFRRARRISLLRPIVSKQELKFLDVVLFSVQLRKLYRIV